MVKWQNDWMAERENGKMVEWQNIRLVAYQDGRMAGWKIVFLVYEVNFATATPKESTQKRMLQIFWEVWSERQSENRSLGLWRYRCRCTDAIQVAPPGCFIFISVLFPGVCESADERCAESKHSDGHWRGEWQQGWESWQWRHLLHCDVGKWRQEIGFFWILQIQKFLCFIVIWSAHHDLASMMRNFRELLRPNIFPMPDLCMNVHLIHDNRIIKLV